MEETIPIQSLDGIAVFADDGAAPLPPLLPTAAVDAVRGGDEAPRDLRDDKVELKQHGGPIRPKKLWK